MPRDYRLRHPEFENLIRIVAGKFGIDPAPVEKRRDHAWSLLGCNDLATSLN
jgi:hypothetical protein